MGQTIDSELCAYHAKLQQQRNDMRMKNIRKGGVNVVSRLFGKSSLQRKLDYHNLKMKVDVKKSNKVQHRFEEGDNVVNDKMFTRSELSHLTEQQLEVISHKFEMQIKLLNKELADETEERDRLADDTHGLSMTVGRLEELVLREMKPWVNVMPECNEMTRAMLLN